MKKPMLSAEQAIHTMLQQVQAKAGTEFVTLAQALDRVLCQAVYSAIDVPGYDNAAMDGYALRAAEVKPDTPLTIAGAALAGHAFTQAVPVGACVRITTGAVLPSDLDTVVMQELVNHVDVKGQPAIACQLIPEPGEHVRKAGEDIGKGQLVFNAGHKLRPADIGLLASLGFAGVEVKPQLKVAILSSGDELIAPGDVLPAGKIYDSNRFVIKAMLQRLGVDVMDLGLLPDNPQQIEQAFQQAMAEADVLITSAGVSVGDADYTRQILHKLGQIDFWQVAIKPGKPFAFGQLQGCWFFGLPGNPVAAVVTLEQLVQPVLRKLSGEVAATATQTWQAQTMVDLKKQPGRQDFQRGWFWQDADGLKVKTLGAQSSGMLSSIANANCYIVLAADNGGVQSGDIVTILPFSALLR